MEEQLSTLLLPTETSPIALDIKRALLTFDQVNLLAPEDREIIDPASFWSAISPVPLPFAFGGGGSVLPLGKRTGYDLSYQETIDECEAALKQGSVVVRNSVALTSPDTFIIGAQPNPTDWAPPNAVMAVFRQLVARPEVLLAASRGLPKASVLCNLNAEELAPGGRALTHGFGQPPTVGAVNDGSLSEEVAGLLQRLAAARLGAVIKCIGLCESTGLHPSSNDAGMNGILEYIQTQASTVVANGLSDDGRREELRRALRVERIVFEHQLPDAVLSQLSVSDVLKLRTSAWGRTGKARQDFFRVVRELGHECDDQEFDRRVRDEIARYQATSTELLDEWRKFSLKVGLPGLAGALTSQATVVQGLLGIPSWGLAAGVATALSVAAGVADEIVGICRKHNDVSCGAGKALVTPYAFAMSKPRTG